MKQAAFVLGVIATVLSTEKKVRYITTDDNVQ